MGRARVPKQECLTSGHGVRASPSWPTYEECRAAHLSCPDAQLPPKASPLLQLMTPVR
jgi:hypothetical protein